MRVGLVRFGITLLSTALLAWGGCGTSRIVENRETPVHVWLTIPAMAAQGGQVQALVYVGSHKVVEGPVVFPQGVSTVNLPTAFLPAGDKRVSVVLDGGRRAANDAVDIQQESWIQIIVEGGRIRIRHEDEQPNPAGG